MGVRTWDDVTFPGYGKIGDGHLYASNEMNGLNIINRQGTGSTEDYIRFYAGQDANGTTPDIHIQGSGSTRGFIGINTITPTRLLDVNGTARINGNLTLTTIGGTTPVINLGLDSNGLVVTGTTGGGGGGGTTTITGVTLNQTGWTFNVSTGFWQYDYVNAAIVASVQVDFTPYNASNNVVILANVYPFIELIYIDNKARMTADYQPSSDITGQIVIY
jgi:hypothetical protein